MPTPTPVLEQQIVAFIRAGGFPQVAAEAAGVSRQTFRQWLRDGRQEDANAACRHFAQAVMVGAAQARLRAEIATLENKPLDWLRFGPGKQTGRNPGWTGPVRAPAPKVRTAGNPLDSVEGRAIVAEVLVDLEAHSELRTRIAGRLLRQKCRRTAPLSDLDLP